MSGGPDVLDLNRTPRRYSLDFSAHLALIEEALQMQRVLARLGVTSAARFQAEVQLEGGRTMASRVLDAGLSPVPDLHGLPRRPRFENRSARAYSRPGGVLFE